MLIQHIPVKLSCPCHSRATAMPRPCHFRSGPCHSLKSVAHSRNTHAQSRTICAHGSHIGAPTRIFPAPVSRIYAQRAHMARANPHQLAYFLHQASTGSDIPANSRTMCAHGSCITAPTRKFPAPGSHWRGNSRTIPHIIAPGADIPAHWRTNSHISRTSLAHLRTTCAHGSRITAPTRMFEET
jgi:hypothetical protein